MMILIFFLPQLCTLLISRDKEVSKQLECYILYKCMKSIDFAIKCFWNLHAIQFYSKLEGHKNRCDEMRQNLEMIVVNGQLPRNLFMQLPQDIQKESLLENQNDKQHNNNGHIISNGKNNKNNKNNKPLSSALPQPKKPNNIQPKNDPLLNGATEYLKKQRRCTYFNAELDFAHFLEGVSSALEQCDREDRPRLLEDNIRYANKCLPRGLYIPIAHNASDNHKSLLRIVPNEGNCLDSKQKVPFLLFCEIEQHNYPTSSPAICEELTESETALLSSFGHKIRKHIKLLDFQFGGFLFMKLNYPIHAPRHLRCDKKHLDFQRNHYLRMQKKNVYKTANISCYSGLYVLIDEHRKRHHKEKNKQKHQNINKKNVKKKDNPKRLKPTKRKPSKPILYKKNKQKNKNIDNIINNNTPTPPVINDIEHTVSNILDCDEYSIPSKDIAYTDDDDDDDEIKKDITSDDYISEPSKSQTITNPKPQRMAISSIPTPKPKPIDKIAEQAMKRHLEALKPFEPHNNNKNNNNNNKNKQKNKQNEILLSSNDKNKIESQPQGQLLSVNN
eukprot:61513_1